MQKPSSIFLSHSYAPDDREFNRKQVLSSSQSASSLSLRGHRIV